MISDLRNIIGRRNGLGGKGDYTHIVIRIVNPEEFVVEKSLWKGLVHQFKDKQYSGIKLRVV